MDQDWSDLTIARPPREMTVEESRKVGDNLYRATIFANEKARSGPDVSMRGLSFTNYRKNPVVMFAHDTMGYTASGGLPIGKTTKLERGDDGKIVADFEFLPDDPFASRVQNAWEKRFLRAASISWKPLESKPRTEEEGGGWVDTKSDLLEWSIVAVPADPDAVRTQVMRMLDQQGLVTETTAARMEIGIDDLDEPESEPEPSPADAGDLRVLIRQTLVEMGLTPEPLVTVANGANEPVQPVELPLDDIAERVAQLHASLTEGAS